MNVFKSFLFSSIVLMSIESQAIHCQGDEPWFSADISDKEIKLEYNNLKFKINVFKTNSLSVGPEFLTTYKNKLGARAVVRPIECSTNQSTFKQDVVIFSPNGDVLYGCCGDGKLIEDKEENTD